MDYTSYKIAQATQNEMLQEARRSRQIELAKQTEEKTEIIPVARPARSQVSFILRLFGWPGKASL
jgi:hypothetical protein